MSEAQLAPATPHLFWPPPRRQVLRYLTWLTTLTAFPFLLLGLLVLTVVASEGPGVLDPIGHMQHMLPGVVGVGVSSVGLGVVLALFSLFWVRRKSRYALTHPALAAELAEGEVIQGLCPAYVDQDRVMLVTWGEFLVVTPSRLLGLKFRKGGRNADCRVLSQRDDITRVETVDRRAHRHPLKATALELLGETSGLVFHLEDGGAFFLMSECLFFENLVAWLTERGFPLEAAA